MSATRPSFFAALKEMLGWDQTAVPAKTPTARPMLEELEPRQVPTVGIVKVINPAGRPSDIQYLTNVNGILFFSAKDATHGYELWESNGKSAGTFLVKDIYPGNGGSDPQNLTNVNGV